MKNLILTAILLCACAVCGAAQTATKADAALDAAMEKFKSSVINKQPTVFLSFISKTKGLTIMNTIDQGEAGNADKPMLVSNLKYATLAADFKKKGENYQDFFVKSEFDASLYDNFAGNKGKWSFAEGNKFMPIDPEDKTPIKAIYVKWEKEADRWIVTEIGRPIS